MAVVANGVYPDLVEEGKVPGPLERVLERAEFLNGQDRVMVQSLRRGDLYFWEIAELMGISRSALTRRWQRLLRRLADPLIAALIEGPKGLREEFRQIGIEHYLQGLSVRVVAEKHRMSPWEVRQILRFVRGWCSRDDRVRG